MAIFRDELKETLPTFLSWFLERNKYLFLYIAFWQHFCIFWRFIILVFSFLSVWSPTENVISHLIFTVSPSDWKRNPWILCFACDRGHGIFQFSRYFNTWFMKVMSQVLVPVENYRHCPIFCSIGPIFYYYRFLTIF